MIDLIHRGTSPIFQEQNVLSLVADKVEISEESQIFWGYGADFGPFPPGFPSNWTYK